MPRDGEGSKLRRVTTLARYKFSDVLSAVSAISCARPGQCYKQRPPPI